MLEDLTVSVYGKNGLYYPKSPFNPPKKYPEFSKNIIFSEDSSNCVYEAVRQSLKQLNCDVNKIETKEWNPFRKLIIPGDIIVIKPNAVLDINQNANESVFASITHMSVVRPIVDYVFLALKGKGRIIIADAPLAHSNFDNWKKITQIETIVELYKNQFDFNIEVFDLRKIYVPFDYKKGFAPSIGRKTKNRDPLGYKEINLKGKSLFSSLSEADINKFYGSDYDREQTVKLHKNKNHRYLVSKTVLNSDLIISIPKLKVHQKVGTTLNIKGMVGTQGDKNYIPHHMVGDISRGGDESPNLGILQNTTNKYRMFLLTKILSKKTKTFDQIYQIGSILQMIMQKLCDIFGKLKYLFTGIEYRGNIVGGSWPGNDTAWRMALDLTRIILYSNKHGIIKEKPQRKFFSMVDGIIGGEGRGPLAPTAVSSGVIVSGYNPLAVDIVSTDLIGLDSNKIKMYSNGLRQKWLKVIKKEDITIIKNSDFPIQPLNYKTPDFWESVKK